MWTSKDIWNLRADLRMSQFDFASHVDVPVSTVQLWEGNITHPSSLEEMRLNQLKDELPGRVSGAVRLAKAYVDDHASHGSSTVNTVILPGNQGSVSTDGHNVYISKPGG
jgi:hypothetical protein